MTHRDPDAVPDGAAGSGPRIFFVAGEVSGDIAAAAVAAELRHLEPSADLVGVGGPRMARAGVRILADSTGWSAIGHLDPLLHLPTHLRRLVWVERTIRRHAPALLVLVDFAAFNLRLAERLARAVPTVYYVPPLVSVRRGQRARKVARLPVRLLVTLPPEADAYRAAGADAVFVGHPAVDLVVPGRETARRAAGIPAHVPVVGLLPGSRPQEVRAHLPVLLEAARRVGRAAGDVWWVLPVPAAELRSVVLPAVRAAPVAVRVVDDGPTAMAMADALVVATGTATLEAAVLGVPMVAVYRLPWISWQIARRIVSARYAALPNILAGRPVVPELLQDRMTPDAVAGAVVALLRDPQRRERMQRELREVAAGLGPPGVSRRAAQEVVAALRRS
ncbi:MAG: lipid-A-disaccharide synthase [Armatimonadota bacterium]|nr:lipid-A-disaccharide synthase [Armatimonadota bacterium]MDR7401482.1 lipid-A-disaccharide synthase [Armatimonadota bacterium]MDR7404767.1 lipid-A-disaccharide synthase [Armatimonadota bacterium]MDR7437521.1 lipid-A-disaccharide synthase [Armatimonadota bacterium]MDR7471710.1 lipid-A-disaccharide synthase [Armatimonadota bacterium]